MPRDESRFIGAWARTWPRAWAGVAVVLGCVFVALGRGPAWQAGLLVAVVLVSWGAGRWATRAIVERPRPSTSEADVLAADDGLRSRALHAVGGAVLLASSWSVVALGVSAALPTEGRVENSPLAVLAWVVMIGLARWAWVRAAAPFPVASAAEPSGAPARTTDGP